MSMEKRHYTDKELLDLLEEDNLDDFLPPDDDNENTDIESSDNEDNFFEDLQNNPVEDEEQLNQEVLSIVVTEVEPHAVEKPPPDNQQEPERVWRKIEKTTIPNAPAQNCMWEEVFFSDCHSDTDIFLKLLGNTIEDITFQTNLYGTQKGKNLNITKEEILSFIGINFLMGYHWVPTLSDYWSTSDDLKVALVPQTMSRNRFQTILSNLHVNDNSRIPKNNNDKLYKVRPMIDTLNSIFVNYDGGQTLCVDESVIKFKGRSTLKQYNPMKPIKRGYKIWCLANMSGFVKKFDIYQGKNESVDYKYQHYGLGERVVLHLTEQDWGKGKIIYFDNFFTTIKLLEKLKLEGTYACGTIRSNRKGVPKNIATDKTLKKRGDFDHCTSNTDITYYKWNDNKIVNVVSNFHGSEEVQLKRKLRDGTNTFVRGPLAIRDYNECMGGVDHHDRLRQCYGIDRRSKKWWHRIFWGLLEITFVNAYVISKHRMSETATSLLQFRRTIATGLCGKSKCVATNKKRPSSSTPTAPKRRYNYSVSSDIRLGNRGSHWPTFVANRGRCEMCSAQGVQSRPHSKCTMCGTFLCVNEKKNCFAKYHDVL